MLPKYIAFFNKTDRHGKTQLKIIPCNTSEEIETAIEIMKQSGYKLDAGFHFDPRYAGYMPDIRKGVET